MSRMDPKEAQKLFPELYDITDDESEERRANPPEVCTCPGETADVCPYDSDVNEQRALCDCCVVCRARCADSI